MYNPSQNPDSLIITQSEGNIETIMINRPEHMNKLNLDCMKALISAIRDAESNTKCRAIVISGVGDYFCGGGDLGDFRVMSSSKISTFGKTLSELILVMKKTTKPIISAVHGPALGGGICLVEASDLSISHHHATFGIPEITTGFCPAIALISVANVFNSKKTMQMALLGETVGAEEALSVGLINLITNADDVLSKAKELAHKIATSNPSSIRVSKELYYKTNACKIESQLEYAIGALVEFLKTDDAKETLDSKEAIRPPNWIGS